MRVAVIGGRGFFGTALSKAAHASLGFDVTVVTRQSYDAEVLNGGFDVVFNSAMPSGRFWAETNPSDDFRETVLKTFNVLTDFAPAKVVQISSVSARCQLNKIYGRHKRAAEALVDDGRNLVVRLGPLYGEELTKGVLIDLVNDKAVYVSGGSNYAFTPIDWAAKTIIDSVSESGIIEVGANGAVMLQDLASALGSRSTFVGEYDHQVFADSVGAPAANEVVAFAHALKALGGQS